MKTSFTRLVLVGFLMLVSSVLSFGQNSDSIRYLYSSPGSPSYSDSVFVHYSYLSSDGCPDYYLEKDSVMGNNVFLSLKKIDNSNSFCTQAITKFDASLNLGFLHENTRIFLDGVYALTVYVRCELTMKGMVRSCNGKLYIQDINSILAVMQLYAINSMTDPTTGETSTTDPATGQSSASGSSAGQTYPPDLKDGDLVWFGGYRVNSSDMNDSCYAVGVANCWEPISVDPACVPDRSGVVVQCDNDLYIQTYNYDDTVPGMMYPDRPIQMQLYTIPKSYDAAGQWVSGLKVGDEVKFYGVDYKLDSLVSPISCPVTGEAKCFELISTIPECIPDRKGVVRSCNGELLVEDLSSPYASMFPRYYGFRNPDGVNSSPADLREGDKLIFKAIDEVGDSTLVDSTLVNSTVSGCLTFGYVACYELIEPTYDCVLDKKGEVVIDVSNCVKGVLIREFITGNLYVIKGADPTVTGDYTYPVLNVGDKVLFGGYLLKTNTADNAYCDIDGVAQCYEVIGTTVPDCEKNRIGTVFEGVGDCANMLFVKEDSTSMIFYVQPQIEIYSTDKMTVGLTPGDRVKFNAEFIYTLAGFVNFCNTAGNVICYDIVEKANTYTLSGKAFVGDAFLQTGLITLYDRRNKSIQAFSKLIDGSFMFNNLPASDFTVCVIPDKATAPDVLPTFFQNHLFYRYANFISLNPEMNNINVQMRKFTPHEKGPGRIFGNIYYESNSLNDTLMVKNALAFTDGSADFRLAINTIVLLLNGDKKPVDWTLTDVNGNYVFENLPLDTFTVISETGKAFASMTVTVTDAVNENNADLTLKSLENLSGLNPIEDQAFGLYPNPASDRFNISVSANSSMQIFNLTGQIVQDVLLNPGQNWIDCRSFGTGVYIVKVGTRSEKLVVK